MTPNFQLTSSPSSAYFELGVYGRAAAAIDFRILTLEVFCENGELILRLLEGRAGFQARADIQLAIVTVLEKILLTVGRKRPRHGQRHVEVGMPEYQHPWERFGSDANHGKLRAVQANRPADDGPRR